MGKISVLRTKVLREKGQNFRAGPFLRSGRGPSCGFGTVRDFPVTNCTKTGLTSLLARLGLYPHLFGERLYYRMLTTTSSLVAA